MRSALQALTGRRGRCLALAAIAAGALLGIAAAGAQAAPAWRVTLTQTNPWGAVLKTDPFTGSATELDRASGTNPYTITVTNVGASAAGGVPVGSVLACAAGPSSASALAYKWLLNGAAISGATGASFTTVAADEGKQVQCEVTATGAEGAATNALSTAVAVAPLPATAAPTSAPSTVTGTVRIGEELTCATGSWSGSPTLTRQWLKNGVAISGATEEKYKLPAEALDAAIQCQVTGANAGGTVLADSAASVVPAAPPLGGTPTLSPSTTPAANGTELTCATGTWTPAPTAYAYQWLRDGQAITGATSSKYTIVEATDKEKAIQCEVTATGAEGSASAVSTAVIGVANPATLPPALSTVGAVSGTYNVGQTLTCKHGTWTPTPASYSYQWLRNGQPIANASEGPTTSESFTYTLTAADLNHSIQCEAIATNESGARAAIGTSTGTVVSPALVAATASVKSPAAVTIVDQLPEGLEFSRGKAGGSEAVQGTGWKAEASAEKGTPGVCVIDAADTTVACTGQGSELAAGASYPPLTLNVHVDPGAPDAVTNTVTVSGGGAQSASASDTTQVTTVPFGIASLTAGALGYRAGAKFNSATAAVEGATTFTQAGGHPWAIAGTAAGNLTTNDTGELRIASGSIRDLYAELPPGLLGNPQNAPQCPLAVFNGVNGKGVAEGCPAASIVGFIDLSGNGTPATGLEFDSTAALYNLVPPPGHPALFGFGYEGEPYTLYGSVRSDGDYGVTVSSVAIPSSPAIIAAQFVVCDNGVEGTFAIGGPSTATCAPPNAEKIPFLTYPTQCAGPTPVTYVRADNWLDPGVFAEVGLYANGTALTGHNAAGGQLSINEPTAQSFTTGCNEVPFKPEISMVPSEAGEGGTSQADEPSGTTFRLKVPQPNTQASLASSALRDATVTLPEGLSLDAPAADGLEACTNAQFGLGLTVEPTPVAECPLASQVGTVEVFTPLLPDGPGGTAPLDGQVFVGQPECDPCTNANAEHGEIFRLFLQMYSQKLGVDVKVAGNVAANPATGQLQATFKETPQLPFGELVFKFKGGPRAPLANPQTCGTFTTTSDLTPWSAPGLGGLSGEEAIPGTADAVPASAFEVTGCGAGMGFAPSFNAGPASTTAGVYTNLGVTFGREDREQDLSGVTIAMPPGLLGKIAGIPLCGEAQANAGSCGAESEIGTVTAAAGAGSDPFSLEGHVYLTEGYKGQPFGLSIVVPAVAGPFNLGDVVVRASIAVNPITAQITVATNPLPQVVDGVPVRLRDVHVNINREDFILNATNCSKQQTTGTFTGVPPANDSGEASKGATVGSSYDVGGCQNLKFTPKFSVSTSAKTSKAGGASLTTQVAEPNEAQGSQANIAKVKVELPKQLPSRLTTLQKACTNAQFESNPAACPSESKVGYAVVHTPILPVPLEGPAIFVSHGGEAFPSLTLVLQGDNVTIDLVGTTFISKAGVTSTTFKAVPDAPFSTFALTLPEGKYSALTTDGNLCTSKLTMPTEFVAQNGAAFTQNSPIAVEGCKPEIIVTSHKVKNGTATIKVSVPSAGKLAASGKGLSKASKKASKATTLTIKLKLSKQEQAFLKKHKGRKLKSKVNLTFTPTKGAKLKTSVTVLVR